MTGKSRDFFRREEIEQDAAAGIRSTADQPAISQTMAVEPPDLVIDPVIGQQLYRERRSSDVTASPISLAPEARKAAMLSVVPPLR